MTGRRDLNGVIMKLNVPTTLTLIRLVLSPLILPVLLVNFLPYNSLLINICMALVFVGFSLTDFFDGYLARKNGQETALGTILDPIADKFLFYSTLIALLVAHKIFFFWVVILIGREFFMMGLRQVALEHHFSVPVSAFGKYKTALQMSCLTFIILNPYHAAGYSFQGLGLWNVIESVLLFLTISFSVVSAKTYFDNFMRQFNRLALYQNKKDAQ